MKPDIRTEGQVAMPSLHMNALSGRTVIDTLIRRTSSSFRSKVSNPLGLHAVLKIAARVHRELYRRTGGKIGSTVRGGPVLLLTTHGRRTGKGRTHPLSYVHDGNDLVVVASAAGAPRHPAWFLNLQANPLVRVQQGGVSMKMTARIADERDRTRLWERVVQRYPVAASYQRRTGRQLPVVILRSALSAKPPPQPGLRFLEIGIRNARNPSWTHATA